MLYSTKMVTTSSLSIHMDEVDSALIRRAIKSGGSVETSSGRETRKLEDDQHHPPPSILPIDVRSPRLRDASGLRHLRPLYRLDQPDSLLVPFSPMRAGLAASLPGGQRRRPAFVALAGDRLVGFAQFEIGAWDQRWHAVALGASVGVFEAEPVWETILTQAVRAAGLRGVKRLFARVPIGEPINRAFRRLGWSPYAGETLFAATDPPPRRQQTRSIRSQVPVDTWAIHQLYSAVVPHEVQAAEAFTSHVWDLNGSGGTRRSVRQQSWVMIDGHQLIGYVSTRSRDDSHVIEVLSLPERRAILPDLLAMATGSLPKGSRPRVYCAVRGYQAETATALEASGFVPILEQDLLVKYTTAPVLAPVTESVEFHVEARDPLPKRVPTFLQGQPGDR